MSKWWNKPVPVSIVLCRLFGHRWWRTSESGWNDVCDRCHLGNSSCIMLGISTNGRILGIDREIKEVTPEAVYRELYQKQGLKWPPEERE